MNVNSFDSNNNVFLAEVIELFPTKEQIDRIMQFIYASNYIYDITIDWCDDQYVKYMNNDSRYMLLSKIDANLLIAEYRSKNEFLYSIPLHTCREAVHRCIDAYKQYLNGISGRPLKHYPNNLTMSFSTPSDVVVIEGEYLKMQGFIDKSALGYKVGRIRCQNRGYTKFDKFYNTSIFIDNMNRFYLYATRIHNKITLEIPKTDAIGIDIGYRLDGSNTIVCSDSSRYCQPDTTHLQCRIRQFQLIVGKDYSNRLNKANEMNVNVDTIHLSNREQENMIKFQLASKRLADTLDTFYNQATIDIIKKNPVAIVIEDNFAAELKRSNNLINYGVACGGKIRNMLLYKANEYRIPVFVAASNFKSSYICSKCGHIRTKDLKQSKIFKCENPYCGFEIDRDLNAAINLANIYRYNNGCLSYDNYIKQIL